MNCLSRAGRPGRRLVLLVAATGSCFLAGTGTCRCCNRGCCLQGLGALLVPLEGGWRWWDVGGGGAAAFATEVDGEAAAASRRHAPSPAASLACPSCPHACLLPAWSKQLKTSIPTPFTPSLLPAPTLIPMHTSPPPSHQPTTPITHATIITCIHHANPLTTHTHTHTHPHTPLQACASSPAAPTSCCGACRHPRPAFWSWDPPTRGRFSTTHGGCLMRRTRAPRVRRRRAGVWLRGCGCVCVRVCVDVKMGGWVLFEVCGTVRAHCLPAV